MSALEDFERRVTRAARAPHIDEDEAERRGYDSVVSGPNMVNCHFAIFATKANTTAWERGRDRALSLKSRTTPDVG